MTMHISRRHPDDNPWAIVLIGLAALLFFAGGIASLWGTYRLAYMLGVSKSVALAIALMSSILALIKRAYDGTNDDLPPEEDPDGPPRIIDPSWNLPKVSERKRE